VLTIVDSAPQSADVPGDWSSLVPAEFRGTLQFTRFFNRPTGIDASVEVHLCFALVDGHAEVALNGESLGIACWPDCPQRFNITHLLENRNELVVRLSLLDTPRPTPRPPSRGADSPGGLIGEVQLEIG
jgi:hypothetical protein